MRSEEQEHRIQQRLINYGVVALAATGALTAARPAHADIQVFLSGLTTTSAPDNDPSNNDVFFDFATGVSQKSNFAGADYRLNNDSGDFASLIQVDPLGQWLGNDLGCPARLAAGALIGPGGAFGNDFSTLAGDSDAEWNDLGRDYVGLQFEVSGNTHFGWADIEVHEDFNVTLHRFGYQDTPNTSLLAGAVGGGNAAAPEPTPLALLLLGAAGIGAYRRMRN